MNIGNLDIGINLDTGKLTSNLDSVTAKTRSWGKEIDDLSNFIAKTFVVGITALAAGLYTTAKAAGDAEEADYLLGVAMKNAGIYTHDAYLAIKDYTEALATKTLFTDEDLKEAAKVLISYGAEGQQLKDLLQATADLAQFKKMDMVSASQLVGRAIDTESDSIKNSGVQLVGAAGSAEKMQSAIKGLAELCGGQALAATEGFKGQVELTKKAFEELEEKIGKISINVLAPFVKIIKNDIIPKLDVWASNTKNVKDVSLILQNLIKGALKTFIGFAGAIDIITDAMAELVFRISNLTSGLETVANKVATTKTPFKDLAGVIYDIGTLNFKGLLDSLSPSTGTVADKTTSWAEKLKEVDDTMKKMGDESIPSVIDQIDKAPTHMEKMASDWETATGQMTTRADLMVEAFGYSLGESGMSPALQGFTNFVNSLKEASNPLKDLMSGTATALQNAFVDAFDKILVHGQSWNTSMGEIWNSFKETMIKTLEEILAKEAVLALLDLIKKLWSAGDSASGAAAISSQAQAIGFSYDSDLNRWSESKFEEASDQEKINWETIWWEIGTRIVDSVKEGWESADDVLKDWGDKLADVFGWAGGVRNFQGGLSLVGEQGPELLNLPRGSDVFSNGDTRQMLSGGSSRSNNPINIVIQATVRADEDWEKVTRNKIIPSLERYMKKTYNSPFA